VQDYDAKVQQAINRVQPFEIVEKVTNAAREIGYKSISHDLVFGLPFQNWNSMSQTIEKTKLLKPDRIAFYSYAHVPWIKGVGQRGFDENDLPEPGKKRELYEKGKELLGALGYIEIGMDHFSLPEDSLAEAMKHKTIHRNFMGYSSSSKRLMIGLGMSAISDSWYAFAQNDKSVEGYMQQVEQDILPVFRGHILTGEDLIVRRHILNLMCLLETSWEDEDTGLAGIPDILRHLKEMENDGLVIIGDKHLQVTEAGRSFVRNVAMAWDLRMMRNQPGTRIFSMTV
jgi:oxygen-independent coproporphyrinogen-3 oxidase